MKKERFRYKVLHIGGLHKKKNSEVWGGTVATSKYLWLAFKNDLEFDVTFVDRRDLRNKSGWDLAKIGKITKGYHIIHLDDSGLCNFLYENGFRVDVIGPICRAPSTVKKYSNGWEAKYSEEWFYSGEVMRLNISEEKNSKFIDKISFVDHGVPTRSALLIPDFSAKKKYILWAGDKKRHAKNFDMMREIMKITKLPKGFEFKVLSGYNAEDYWALLDEAAILINTSRWESFCCAMFEAKTKAVPVIYKKNLHSGRFLDNRIQVEYTAEAYKSSLLGLLNDKELLKSESELSRQYVLDHATLQHMRDSWVRVYRKVIKKKYEV